MPEQYKKPALTFEQQLSHLQNRGLVINDQADALLKLSAISYYRLSGYWFPFRLRDKNGQPGNHFIAGTGFDQVLELRLEARHGSEQIIPGDLCAVLFLMKFEILLKLIAKLVELPRDRFKIIFIFRLLIS